MHLLIFSNQMDNSSKGISMEVTCIFNLSITPSVIEDSFEKAINMDHHNSKAAKNDDALIPEYLWDDCIVPDGNPVVVNTLPINCTFALRWW